jgi:hypothetical protein
MTTSTVDRMVADYLGRLEAASAPLPPDRRDELLDEIGNHIDTARAAGGAADEAAVRDLLDRLGPPEVIAAAARDDDDTSVRLVPPRSTGLEQGAVVMLTLGSFIPVLGWLVGVVLLWVSPRWRGREKLLGTLVVPLGPGLLLTTPAWLGYSQDCTTYGGPQTLPDGRFIDAETVVEVCADGPAAWPYIALLAFIVIAPVVVAVLLYRRAKARAALEPPRPEATSPWGGLEISAVVLLALGAFVVPVLGPLVGLGLAWASPRWTQREKAVPTLLAVVPSVLAALLAAAGLMALRYSVLGTGGFLLLAVAALGPLAAAGHLTLTLSRRHGVQRLVEPPPPAPPITRGTP